MPLLQGNSPAVQAKNFHEFHGGKTYAHTLKKFGKARANAQAVAAVLHEAGKNRDYAMKLGKTH